MRILLSTIIDNINYGTYLQAFATAYLLRKKGHQVDILNYIRPHLTAKVMFSNARKHGIVSMLKAPVMIGLDAIMKRNLKRFLSTRVHLTAPFTDWIAFKKKIGGYDLYLTGSDQVWNTTHNHGIDEVYFWGGIAGKKCSYAASVGIESFPEQEQESIKKLLAEYSFISVRESFGIDALRQLDIPDATQVLDPTLMLDSKEWKNVTKCRFRKEEPYLLVYSVEVNKDREVLNIARKIANERGLKIYVVSPYLKFNSRLKVDKVFSMADTDTFLALFHNADYAVVSSFHGTAFAINFNRQFVTVAPERFSTRVQSILSLLNLSDRYVSNAESIPTVEIDYNRVNSRLDEERKRSAETLKKLLEA